jgi:hypothetical protein
VTVLVDRPRWPGPRDLKFAHLVSDASFEELHSFVGALDLPRPLRFHRDHYDVPEPFWPSVVDAGARVTTTKDLVRRRVRAISAGTARPRRCG